MKITDYKLVWAHFPVLLEEHVMGWIKEGYDLYGAPLVTHDGYAQAMIKIDYDASRTAYSFQDIMARVDADVLGDIPKGIEQ